uniref:GNAT family N-acetyltransferase n=1 Tax=uncultured Allobacillus sp. TaxID=1638025 RepID=UPI00338FB86E
MIHYVLNKSVETSKSTVFLAVDMDNQNAISLYRKLNFEKTMLNRTYGITVNSGSRQ